MREAWIRFGVALYLDAQKRQYNTLQWPYIGPVVLDCELMVQVTCEALVLEESLEA
jgi:hypothetical protein